MKEHLSIFDLIEDLGFVENYKGLKGYIKLNHPDLTVEFLVPERGRGTNFPYKIPQLGINAVSLRFLDFLASNTIKVNFEGLEIIVPHPAVYALHKFIIFKRRLKADKHDRDIEGALRVFHELIKNKDQVLIRHFFEKMHRKWQAVIIKNLKAIGENDIVDFLMMSK